MKKASIFLCLFLPVFLSISCAEQKKEVRSDVDFSGAWVRENDLVSSAITIEQKGSEVKFLWKQKAKDGSWKIECDTYGECDKIQDGEKVEHYSFSVGISEDGQRLVVNWIAKNLKSGEIVPFVDEMEITSDGKELISRPIEFNSKGDKVYKGEEYRFRKSADPASINPE
ncbi:MAG: hypothetical protein AB1756_03370 [Acidobacteriota bacterium]